MGYFTQTFITMALVALCGSVAGHSADFADVFYGQSVSQTKCAPMKHGYLC